MTKIDLKKQLDCFKAKPNEFRLVELPEFQYLMVDGHGDPNTSQEFSDAISALYPVAYKLKFASKQQMGQDYVVAPLEGLWWAEDMRSFTTARDKSKWSFTLMLMQPDWITSKMFAVAVSEVANKSAPSSLSKVRLETLKEGTCFQTLHIGSFDDEAEVLDHMHSKVIPDGGFRMSGKHHEIYLSDRRRTAPEKLKTILRQPVERLLTKRPATCVC